MKTTSKILSILLVLAMVLSIAPFAFAAEADATLSFATTDNRVSFSTTQQVWSANGITFTNDKADYDKDLGDYIKPVRCYKGTSLKIEYAGMMKIVVHCNSTSYATTLKNSITASEGVDVSGKDVTISFASAQDSYTVALTAGQVRIDSIDVYKTAGTESGNQGGEQGGTETAPELKDVSVALAGANDASFKVKGVVTCVDGQNIYLQDATGAICARMSEAPADIKLGDTIIAVGKKSVYNGLPQLGSATYEKSTGLTLSAKETTIGALTEADICTYVSLKNLEVTDVYDNNGAYTAPNITVKDAEGNTIQLYKAVIEKKDGAWTVKVGDVINVKAAVSTYNKLQLRNTSADEIVVQEKDTTPTPEHEHKLTKVEKVEATTEQAGCQEHYKCETCGKLFTDAEGKNETTAAALAIAKLPATDDKTENKKDDVETGKTELKPISKTPVAETGYKFGLYNKKLDKTLYFSGEMSGYYLGTTTDASKAANVYLETVEGGYKLYFKNAEGKKQYIEIYTYLNDNNETKVGVHITDEATNIYTWNAELKVLVSNVNGDDYYLGTYYLESKDITYETMSASKLSYISGDNASKIGDTQYPAYLYAEVNVSTGDNTNLMAIAALMVVAMAGMAVVIVSRKRETV